MDVFNIVCDYRAFTSELFCKMCGIIETHLPHHLNESTWCKSYMVLFLIFGPNCPLYTNTVCFPRLKFTNRYKESLAILIHLSTNNFY